MEIEQAATDIVGKVLPDSDFFLADVFEFNKQLDEKDNLAFPVVFLDKFIRPTGSVAKGLMKESAPITLIVLEKPSDIEIDIVWQLKMITNTRGICRRMLLEMMKQIPDMLRSGQVLDNYTIEPVFWHTDAHLIGSALNVTIEYYPEVIC